MSIMPVVAGQVPVVPVSPSGASLPVGAGIFEIVDSVSQLLRHLQQVLQQAQSEGIRQQASWQMDALQAKRDAADRHHAASATNAGVGVAAALLGMGGAAVSAGLGMRGGSEVLRLAIGQAAPAAGGVAQQSASLAAAADERMAGYRQVAAEGLQLAASQRGQGVGSAERQIEGLTRDMRALTEQLRDVAARLSVIRF